MLVSFSGAVKGHWLIRGLVSARVNAVAFNEESNVVFSGSTDCTIQAFDNRGRSEKAIQVS